MSYDIYRISREQFIRSITDNKEDKFAKTFVAKCDMINAWDDCSGIFIDDKVAAAIVTTYSKRLPKTANLQLIHTFAEHRKKGMGKELCELSLFWAQRNNCKYFRVSAEPDAVEFYKSIGFKFIGRQKSGCQLSIFPIERDTNFTLIDSKLVMDEVIKKAVYSKRKGGCVEVFYDNPN